MHYYFKTLFATMITYRNMLKSLERINHIISMLDMSIDFLTEDDDKDETFKYVKEQIKLTSSDNIPSRNSLVNDLKLNKNKYTSMRKEYKELIDMQNNIHPILCKILGIGTGFKFSSII